ncbi:pseudouridylate synthase RPUSD2 [Ambystoma mexicanum]|uniref:pseudouridylate synthase RPUSD2 n=1 Tax=Ambystoma mexicanum TaxID=8296 RepID=UPI0037E70BF0
MRWNLGHSVLFGLCRPVTQCGVWSTLRRLMEETGVAKRKNEAPEQQQVKRQRGTGGGQRYVPPPKKRHPGVGFSEQHFQEAHCYLEGGLRKVRPYYFDFETYCKGRWVGKSLLEVFSSEFRAEPIEYYLAAAEAGRLRLNEEPVRDLGVVLKNNDFLRNTVHRHEPPVTAQPISIIDETDEMVIVDKPSSLPVHPCGRFRHNTVIFILGKEHNLTELHTVHRLDRMTSGVLMFAKTLEVSKSIDQQVRERQLEKEYVCRVRGEFPEGELVCEEPILVVSYKVGVCRVDPKGKASKTVFQRLSYNGKSSVVKCFPHTGRTHQIRVHLQFLGHAIINDPIYNTDAWGPNKGKGGKLDKTDDELLKALVEEHRLKQSLDVLDLPEEELKFVLDSTHTVNPVACALPTKDLPDQNAAGILDRKCSQPEHPLLTKDLPDQNAAGILDSKCSQPEHPLATPSLCQVSANQIDQCKTGTIGDALNEEQDGSMGLKDPLCGECKLTRSDPTPKDLVMYLHALRYKGALFDYSTKMPDWALEDWQEDGEL